MDSSDLRPSIFFIETDDDTRDILRRNLKQYGYHLIMALDEEDALERVSDGHFHADLIIANFEEPSARVLDSARRICAAAGLAAATPIVVISSEYPAELSGQDVAVSATEYVTYLDAPFQLQRLLHSLLPVGEGNGMA